MALAEKILVIDDKHSIVEILETTLKKEGYEVDSALEGEKALEMLDNEVYDLIFCDVNLPDTSGMEILRKVKEKPEPSTVVMITAYGSIENAIECMKLGADDYVTKPFNLEEIKAIAGKGLEKGRLVRENILMRRELEKRYDFSGIIGRSKLMEVVFDKIKKVSPANVAVLVTGETGVGKELVAKAIHYNSGKKGKLVPVNCAAIPDNLMESELFGHVKGAFTGALAAKRGLIEEAEDGTLLLDEIADLHPSLQAKLLRTLDEGSIRKVGDTKHIPVKFRLVCSTNKNLAEEVENQRFRLDLFHRIKVMEINIPPLRERREDIIPLVESYLEKLCAEYNKPLKKLDSGALNVLLTHEWRGNVRELINVLEQSVLMYDADTLDAENLSAILAPLPHAVRSDSFPQEDSLKAMLGKVEKDIIVRVLKDVDGNRKEAARRLAMSERTLYYKLEEYDLK